jgi:hypothetical protein
LGWKPGVQVNLGLKAGTNSLHGTAYAFGRAGSWDALNFFQPTNVAVPSLGFEQYGATAGGPIKKDKLFWFVGYEAQMLNLGITAPIKAPVSVGLSPADPTSSFVDACNTLNPTHLAAGAAGNPITALSARLAGLDATTCTVSPASATVENVFDYNPGNQFPGNPVQVVATGLNSMSDVNSTYNGVVKVDFHANDRNTFSGMFFNGQGSGTWNDNPSAITSAFYESLFPVTDRFGSGSWTFVPNSVVVNEFKVGYSYYHLPFNSVDSTANPNAPWGVSGGIPTGYAINTGVTDKTYFGFPIVNVSGFVPLGGNWPKFVGPATNTEFIDHISYLHGKHAFKFGGEFTVVQSTAGATRHGRGSIKFSNLENFLTGTVSKNSDIFVGDAVRDVHTDHFAAFFQDDYRMTPRVTVNIGIRYELATVLKETADRLGNFDPNSATGMVQVGQGVTSPYNPDHRDWSPRVGFAWDLQGNQKTVIRAGASLLYEFVPFSAYMNSGGNSVGLGKVPTGGELCVGGICNQGPGTIAATTFAPPPATMTAGWNSDGATPIYQSTAVVCGDGTKIPPTGPPSLVGTKPGPCTISAFTRNLRTPYVITWNFDIQRAITQNLSLDLAYLGNHGVKLYGVRDINAPAVGTGYSAGFLTSCAADPTTCQPGGPGLASTAGDLDEFGPYHSQFPYLSYIYQLSNLYRSHYHAVQASLTQRTSHGLSFTAAYTYSHATDDVSQNFGASAPLNNLAPDASNYGNSDYDIRHRFTFELTYALPGLKSPGQVLQGWQLNSVVTLQTATPWAVQDTNNDFSGTGEVGGGDTWGEAWNFAGNPKDFTATPNGLPFFGPCPTTASACAGDSTLGINNAACTKNAAVGTLAYASLFNNGCFVVGNSALTPPAYGTYGTVGKNIFRETPFRTWDMSVQKNWKFKERLTAQFRAEVFNVLNHPLFGAVDAGHLAANDPSQGSLALANATPDQASGNPVLGSGSNRDVQLGLKLIF